MTRGLALILEAAGDRLGLAAPEVLRVERSGHPPCRLGIKTLESVVLGPAVEMQAAAITALAAAGVPVTLLASSRHPSHTLAQHGPSGLAWRRAQFKALESPEHCLELAAGLIRRKLAAQASALALLNLPSPKLLENGGRVERARSVDELRGIEGAAARAYWGVWGQRWSANWQFDGRNRLPPKDPLNALLSLGYTLAQSAVAAKLARRGLALDVGYLHTAQNQRASLVLDLLEPVRPVVDLWVVQVVEALALQPEHFSIEQAQGCRLQGGWRKPLYAHWFMHGLPPVAHAALAEVRWLQQALKMIQPELELTEEEALPLDPSPPSEA